MISNHKLTSAKASAHLSMFHFSQSKEKCAGGGESSGTLASSLAVWKTTTEEEPQLKNATSPKKMHMPTTPKTTSSPGAPKCRKVVTVVPQTPLPGTSPSSASKASPRSHMHNEEVRLVCVCLDLHSFSTLFHCYRYAY